VSRPASWNHDISFVQPTAAKANLGQSE